MLRIIIISAVRVRLRVGCQIIRFVAESRFPWVVVLGVVSPVAAAGCATTCTVGTYSLPIDQMLVDVVADEAPQAAQDRTRSHIPSLSPFGQTVESLGRFFFLVSLFFPSFIFALFPFAASRCGRPELETWCLRCFVHGKRDKLFLSIAWETFHRNPIGARSVRERPTPVFRMGLLNQKS